MGSKVFEPLKFYCITKTAILSGKLIQSLCPPGDDLKRQLRDLIAHIFLFCYYKVLEIRTHSKNAKTGGVGGHPLKPHLLEQETT